MKCGCALNGSSCRLSGFFFNNFIKSDLFDTPISKSIAQADDHCSRSNESQKIIKWVFPKFLIFLSN